MYKNVITFGTFDLFHVGHLRLLERASLLGEYLIVGVSTDELSLLKGKTVVIPLNQRLEIVRGLRCVDDVFIEESLEEKENYIRSYHADLLVMGDDWKGKFDDISCDVKYLERTHNISTTILKKRLKD